MPNTGVYPFQWLWDSCFHAIVWCELGEPTRAHQELTHLFRTQDAIGFVPHVDYEAAPETACDVLGPQRRVEHHPAADVRARRGRARDGEGSPSTRTCARHATAGLRFLLEHRARDPSSGPDHDRAPVGVRRRRQPAVGPLARPRRARPRRQWYETKGRLLDTIVRSESGRAAWQPALRARARSVQRPGRVQRAGAGVGDAVTTPCARGGRRVGGAAGRTLERSVRHVDRRRTGRRGFRVDPCARRVALPCSSNPAAPTSCFEPCSTTTSTAVGCGPAGVHRDEPIFAPDTYWRGPAWPQLTYLFWVAAAAVVARGRGRPLGRTTGVGARRSGFAEYWEPDTGARVGGPTSGVGRRWPRSSVRRRCDTVDSSVRRRCERSSVRRRCERSSVRRRCERSSVRRRCERSSVRRRCEEVVRQGCVLGDLAEVVVGIHRWVARHRGRRGRIPRSARRTFRRPARPRARPARCDRDRRRARPVGRTRWTAATLTGAQRTWARVHGARTRLPASPARRR